MPTSRDNPSPALAPAEPPARRWVFVDRSGGAYRVEVRAPEAPRFDTMDASAGRSLVAEWVEDAFAPWGTRSPSRIASLVEVVVALSGAPPAWTEGEGETTWEARIVDVRVVLDGALLDGELRCERLCTGVLRPELLDDLPPTLRAPPIDGEPPPTVP